MKNNTQSSQYGPFDLRMTKSQFRRELDAFIHDSLSSTDLNPPSILIPPYILRRRQLEQSSNKLSYMAHEHLEWYFVTDIEEADSIKFNFNLFRGWVLELREKETGLWVVVNPEGDRESITIASKEGFQHVGYKSIEANQNAGDDLLRWLSSIMEKQAEVLELQKNKVKKEDYIVVRSLVYLLEQSFNKGELKGLCIELDMNYENLGGDTLSQRTRELVLYCFRHGLVERLIETCKELRPYNSDWSKFNYVTSGKTLERFTK